MNKKFTAVLLLTMLLSGSVFAGGAVTSEYSALRKEVYEEANKEFRECINSLSDPVIKEEWNKCIADSELNRTADGCIHRASAIAATRLGESNSLQVCKQFVPSKETIINRTDQLAKERNIEKYK